MEREDNKESEREQHNETLWVHWMLPMHGEFSNLIGKQALPYHANVIAHLQIN